ncbi:UDP-glucose 4-epimerase GalE [Acidimangrovimonas sediminis]|uniref:UDP-glucose 4-epimerase GalE n=1 Tax=Acidimangrovimonas sediminis TaxID=2056283 RepID=UPI000C7F7B6E|nr:UDP-glucose 4-epimerase GalE [Acidimangrovimonas sediminis]
MADRILLTGGAGYIGSHIYLDLVAAGFDPVIYDNFSNADVAVLDALKQITQRRVDVVRADVRNGTALRAVLSRGGFAGVIHLAALKSVPESVSSPRAYFDNNLGGLITLMQAMDDAGVNRLVFSSSATVYGTPETVPIPETAGRDYTNPYGFTKLASEQMLEMVAAAEPRWSIGALRYFNPAGAHSSGLIGETPSEKTTNLFPAIARVALGQLPRLTVFGDDYDTPDGSAERDFIHIEDLAAGHVLSLRRLIEDGHSHCVNLGTGRGHTVLEVLHAFAKASGQEIPHVLAPRRPGDVARSVADPAMAETVLGFRARRSLEEMCKSTWRMLEQTHPGARDAA